jgi:hypothetical protein
LQEPQINMISLATAGSPDFIDGFVIWFHSQHVSSPPISRTFVSCRWMSEIPVWGRADGRADDFSRFSLSPMGGRPPEDLVRALSCARAGECQAGKGVLKIRASRWARPGGREPGRGVRAGRRRYPVPICGWRSQRKRVRSQQRKNRTRCSTEKGGSLSPTEIGGTSGGSPLRPEASRLGAQGALDVPQAEGLLERVTRRRSARAFFTTSRASGRPAQANLSDQDVRFSRPDPGPFDFD